MGDHQVSPQPVRAERGEETRQRLLQAAIEVFGRQGFEAGTRALTKRAGVNLAAIPYHFGSKQGLYVAAAEHIAAQIRARIGPALERARHELEDQGGAPLDAARARVLLRHLLEAFARMLVQAESASWARFIIREQMEPSEAFERLYGGLIQPTFGTIAALVGRITGGDPEDEAVRLQVPKLIGQVLIFRAARATVLRGLGWSGIGEREFAAISGLIQTSIDALDAGTLDGASS
jgi:TetR/AcrR family transcriptional regulator, regulator of cefoperazone and chloramphenicol sensitivity